MEVSAVRVQVLVLSRITLTVPMSVDTTLSFALTISPLKVPSKEDPFYSVSVNSALSPTRIVPLSF